MAFMLSLSSNPHNPFVDYDSWLMFDHEQGFDTAGLLARLVSTDSERPQVEQDRDVEEAIDSIVNNPSFAGLYVKVNSEDSV